jgi:hypothetical protein
MLVEVFQVFKLHLVGSKSGVLQVLQIKHNIIGQQLADY